MLFSPAWVVFVIFSFALNSVSYIVLEGNSSVGNSSVCFLTLHIQHGILFILFATCIKIVYIQTIMQQLQVLKLNYLHLASLDADLSSLNHLFLKHFFQPCWTSSRIICHGQLDPRKLVSSNFVSPKIPWCCPPCSVCWYSLIYQAVLRSYC